MRNMFHANLRSLIATVDECFEDLNGPELAKCEGSGDKACIQAEVARKLEPREKRKGWQVRPYWAFDESRMCDSCAALWHLSNAASRLRKIQPTMTVKP